MELSSSIDLEGWTVRYMLAESRQKTGITTKYQRPYHVVFVHGTPWSSVVYKPMIEALLAKGQYKILAHDLPGYGQSQAFAPGEEATTTYSGFTGDTSFALQARALAALLKHVEFDGSNGSPAPSVIAHDIAGAIVLRAHLLHGCDFASMCLMETNCVLPWGDGFYQLVRSQPQPFLDLPRATFEAVVRSVVRSASHGSKLLETGWEDALTHPWLDRLVDGDDGQSTERQFSFVRQIAQANDEHVAEMLEGNKYADVRCAVKIIWAEQDGWIPKSKIDDLIERLGDKVKEFVVVPNAGHLVMIDQPERVAIELFDWLSQPT